MDLSLLEMSLSAACFIVIIIAMRAVFLHKLPKLVFVILWGVVLIRLFVPLSLPASLYAFPALEGWSISLAEQVDGGVSPGSSAAHEGETAPPPTEQNPVTASERGAPPKQWLTPLLMIWAIGFLLSLLSFLIPHLRSRRSYRMSLPLDREAIRRWQQSHPLRRAVQVRQSDVITTPLTYGLLRPVVLLPKSIANADEQQLAFILTHEYTHIRRFDVLTKWLLALALCVHWFNPLVWVMYMAANRDLELSCDEAVVRASGMDHKATYALTLLQWEESRQGSPMVNALAQKPIEERIIAIMNLKKRSITAALLGGVTVAAAIAVWAVLPIHASKAVADNDMAMIEPYIYSDRLAQLAKSPRPIPDASMPNDISFSQRDVPLQMERLAASSYKAIYLDKDMLLRVGQDDVIWRSLDAGATWETLQAKDVDTEYYADWLLWNDPVPGYSMKQMQQRLADGATVSMRF